MTNYELWADIPSGVTVYVPNHALLAIKLENATLVSITENKGRAGWIQTTGRLKGPFEDVYGELVSLEECIVPKPAPRQWQSLQDVPKGVQVRDNVGDRWKRKSGHTTELIQSSLLTCTRVDTRCTTAQTQSSICRCVYPVNGHELFGDNLIRVKSRPNIKRCRECYLAVQRRQHLRRKAIKCQS